MKLNPILLAAAATLALAPAAPAQRAATGTVRGVVYDSLIGRPLEGARVIMRGTSVGATTDGSGRWRIDSVPVGRRTFFLEHPVLDSIGFSNLASSITVVANRPNVLDLALPSLWTMRRAACERATPLARDSGLVYGSLSDVHSGARLSGARVVVSWLVARRGIAGVEAERPSFDLRTDSLGNYYACSVPIDVYVTVQAFAGAGSETGLTERLLGPRGVARNDLAINRAATTTVDSVSGMKRGRATLAGVIRQENGDPRPSARVLVDDAVGEVFADSGGRFVLRGMPAGSQMAMARMIGYGSARTQVDLRDNDTTWIELTLRALTTLDTIRVTASAWASARLDEIEQRARGAHGIQLLEDQIKDKATLRSVFQILPSITVEGRSAYDYTILGRATSIQSGFCTVDVWIDGRRAIMPEVVTLNPDQVIAVEWFPRASQVPLSYTTVGSGCGALLLWTRFMR